MLQLTDFNFEKEIVEYKGLAIVDFWAEWCGPCKAFLPVLQKLSEIMKDKAKICSMNIDDSPKTPSSLGIRSIPTLMMFKHGVCIDTRIGVVQQRTLEKWITSNASTS